MNNNVKDILSDSDFNANSMLIEERLKNINKSGENSVVSSETINAYGAAIPTVCTDSSEVIDENKSRALATSEKGDMVQQLSAYFQESFMKEHGYVMSGPQKRHMKKRLIILINRGIIFIDGLGKLKVLKGYKLNLYK